MRLKFSDLGAERLRRAALGAEAGVGSLRAREGEVVEKRRGVVMVVVEGVVRERRDRRLKSPVRDEDAILKCIESEMSIYCLDVLREGGDWDSTNLDFGVSKSSWGDLRRRCLDARSLGLN